MQTTLTVISAIHAAFAGGTPLRQCLAHGFDNVWFPAGEIGLLRSIFEDVVQFVGFAAVGAVDLVAIIGKGHLTRRLEGQWTRALSHLALQQRQEANPIIGSAFRLGQPVAHNVKHSWEVIAR